MMLMFVKSTESEIISNAAMYMRISSYFFPVLGILTIFRYSLQGLGFSNLSMLSGVMEMIARCGVSLWLVPAFLFLGVCYGDPTAWIAADLFLVPAVVIVYKRLKSEWPRHDVRQRGKSVNEEEPTAKSMTAESRMMQPDQLLRKIIYSIKIA